MPKKKTKNGRIELLRFLFAIMILLFHIQKRFMNGKVVLAPNLLYLFNRGYFGVEFFFLVSGYLLAAGCFAKREVPSDLIGTETASMIFKKFKSIFPFHFFATILTIIVNAIFIEESVNGRLEYVFGSWASLLMLQVFGFTSTWANKLTWYLDVWFMVTFIFYYFLRKHYDVFVKIVCPLLALFILGYMDYQYGSIAGVDVWTGTFYKCFLRGLAEMALGCAAYSFTRLLNKVEFSQNGKRFLAGCEIIGYFAIFVYTCTKLPTEYDFLVLFILTVLVVLTFSDINPCHQIFDKPIFSKLGTMSLLIYLNQFYSIRLVEGLMDEADFAFKLIACVLITAIGSILCYFVVKSINFRGLKKWFLVQ